MRVAGEWRGLTISVLGDFLIILPATLIGAASVMLWPGTAQSVLQKCDNSLRLGRYRALS